MDLDTCIVLFNIMLAEQFIYLFINYAVKELIELSPAIWGGGATAGLMRPLSLRRLLILRLFSYLFLRLSPLPPYAPLASTHRFYVLVVSARARHLPSARALSLANSANPLFFSSFSASLVSLFLALRVSVRRFSVTVLIIV